MNVAALIAITLLLAPQASRAQDTHGRHKAAMDHRGNQAMGFDQAKIRHAFTPSAQGGTIEVSALDARDGMTINQIRRHLREIAKLFKAGDFSKPVFIHAQHPPGADVMKARRAEIEYRFEETPSGGRLTVTSGSAEAVAAIHSFLKFQQAEHKH